MAQGERMKSSKNSELEAGIVYIMGFLVVWIGLALGATGFIAFLMWLVPPK